LTLASGTRLGPYEISSPLGFGGMGEVYRARDSKLDREVAVKVLPQAFSQDPEFLARFEKEAKAVAALNHPNILSIHDFGHENGVLFAVTELLEGETLRARLEAGSVSHRRAVEIAIQIARGLAAAHEKGVIHRDLKPENVFLTSDGRVKILDFGLAKRIALESDETNAPTTPAETEPGAVMGTVGYMSPEQVRGRPVDPRADIFSFGAILYEMLSGRRAFKRDSHVETMNAILKEDAPELAESGKNVPPALDRIVRHCLEKAPEARFHSAGDIAFDLEALSTISAASTSALPAAASRRRLAGWIKAALAVVTAAVVGVLAGRRAPAPEMTVKQLTMLPGAESLPSLSPDGQSFVFQAGRRGREHIFSQRIDGRAAIDLTKDSPAANVEPAISPDGSEIAFRSERDGAGIYLMGATGENLRRLTDTGNNPTWSPVGMQIAFGTDQGGFPFGRTITSELWIVDVGTGTKRKLFGGDAVQPSWSPDGGRIAFWGLPAGTSKRQIWTISASPRPGEPPVPVTDGSSFDWSPVWSPDGNWLYFLSDRGGSLGLWKIAISEKSGRTSGTAKSVTLPASAIERFSIAKDGRRILYSTVSVLDEIRMIRLHPGDGRVESGPETVFRGTISVAYPAVSPDDRFVAFDTNRRQEDLFILGTDGSGLRQLTDDRAKDRGPNYSPDGSRILFYSDRGGRYGVWTIRPDGSGLAPIETARGETPVFPRWSPDGKAISYQGDVTSYIQSLAPGAKPQKLPLMDDKAMFFASGWTPDGRSLLGGPAVLSAAGSGVWIYSIGDRRFEQLTKTGFQPTGIPGGSLVAYLDLDGLRVVDSGTKVSRLLIPMGTNDPIQDYAIGRDGRAIYYVTEDLEGDVWAATAR